MDIKLGIVIIALATLLVTLLYMRKKIVIPILLALGISCVWTWMYRYEYIGDNIFIYSRMNIYPLVLWTCGLTGLYIIERHWIRKRSIIFAVLCYIALLFALEAIGYHLLNIRLASSYPGLWKLDIIHGPPFLQLFYILAGPIYLGFLHLIQRTD